MRKSIASASAGKSEVNLDVQSNKKEEEFDEKKEEMI